MAEPLNPWEHAVDIGRRLTRPGAEFLTVIGASGWCSRCHELEPRFNALIAELPPHVVPMWMDLEEHAEFLGDFIPPDLPLLLRWSERLCVQAAIVEGINLDAEPQARVQLRPLRVEEGRRLFDPNRGELLELPSLWETFSASDA